MKAINPPFKPAIGCKGKAKPNENTKAVAAMFRRTPEEIVDERHSGRFQKTIRNSMRTKEEKHYVDLQCTLFFYEAIIAIHAAAAR